MPEMQTKTLQDRLRAAADTYSDQPPIFGLLFESADLIDTTIAQAESWRLEVEAMREATNRKLGEMREHNRAHIHDRERACMARDKAVSDLQAAETVLAGLAEAEEALRTVLQAQVASKLPQGLTYLLHFTAGFVAPHRPGSDRESIEEGARVFSAASSVEALHQRLEEADAIADAWCDWKKSNDPPGLTVESFEDGASWIRGTPDLKRWDSPDEARAAAWAWYDRRNRLIDRGLAHRGRGWMGLNPWPRCLTWSDEQVAEVERWLVDSTAEMPEVLRG